MIKGKKFELYIGLKDKTTYEEIFTTEDFIKVLSEYCSEKNTGFSMTTQLGGYSHDKGYVTETSLRITLFGIEEEEVRKLGQTLKAFVNTDTIMITSEDCEYGFE